MMSKSRIIFFGGFEMHEDWRSAFFHLKFQNEEFSFLHILVDPEKHQKSFIIITICHSVWKSPKLSQLSRFYRFCSWRDLDVVIQNPTKSELKFDVRSSKLFISMYVTLLKSLSRGNPREVGSMVVRLLIWLPVCTSYASFIREWFLEPSNSLCLTMMKSPHQSTTICCCLLIILSISATSFAGNYQAGIGTLLPWPQHGTTSNLNSTTTSSSSGSNKKEEFNLWRIYHRRR